LGPKTFLAKKGQKNMTTEGPFFRHRVQYIIKTLFGIKNIFGKKGAKNMTTEGIVHH
jgi:hypothetical protein